MKKRLLASLCVAAFALTACDKKPNEAPVATENSTSMAQPAAVSYSSNNNTDIKNDLNQIQTLSNTRAQEAIDFQNKATQAAQKGDKATLTSIVTDMKTYITNFNKELTDLSLKSTEVDAVRSKMIESNNLGIQLSEASIASNPDMKKITELQNQATTLQKELLTEMQALQTKANPAP